jgi:hypothetical protein
VTGESNEDLNISGEALYPVSSTGGQNRNVQYFIHAGKSVISKPGAPSYHDEYIYKDAPYMGTRMSRTSPYSSTG